jgi:hypothetical protein
LATADRRDATTVQELVDVDGEAAGAGGGRELRGARGGGSASGARS